MVHALKPRLVLHVGPHKTGSTTLQVRLAALRKPLKDADIVYPNEWLEGKGHHLLARQLREELDPVLLRSELMAALKGHGTMLLSSENFSLLDAQQVTRFAEAAVDFDVHIISYARRWSELLYSSWQEGVKHGHSVGFPEFCFKELSTPLASRLLNPSSSLEAYSAAFGRESVTVVSYDEIKLKERDLVDHFVEVVFGGSFVAPPLDREPPRHNKSLGPAEAELLRALNIRSRLGNATLVGPQLYQSYRGWRRENRERFQELAAELRASSAPMSFDERSFVSAAVRKRFDDEFAERCVNVPRPGSAFADPEVRRVRYVSERYLIANPRIALQVEQIYEELASGLS